MVNRNGGEHSSRADRGPVSQPLTPNTKLQTGFQHILGQVVHNLRRAADTAERVEDMVREAIGEGRQVVKNFVDTAEGALTGGEQAIKDREHIIETSKNQALANAHDIVETILGGPKVTAQFSSPAKEGWRYRGNFDGYQEFFRARLGADTIMQQLDLASYIDGAGGIQRGQTVDATPDAPQKKPIAHPSNPREEAEDFSYHVVGSLENLIDIARGTPSHQGRVQAYQELNTLARNIEQGLLNQAQTRADGKSHAVVMEELAALAEASSRISRGMKQGKSSDSFVAGQIESARRQKPSRAARRAR